jgi:hypothetical protein
LKISLYSVGIGRGISGQEFENKFWGVDIWEDARLQAAKFVRQIQAAYEQPMSRQKFTITMLAAVLLLLCGVCVGRVSALWWPL